MVQLTQFLFKSSNKGLRWSVSFFATAACLIFFAGCEEKRDMITVYTSLPERDMHEMILAFNQQHPNIKVSFFRGDTTDLMSKLDTEFLAENPRADILLISDDIVMTRLRDSDKLATLDDVDTSHFPKDSFDPQKTFFGTVFLGTGLVCHQDFTPPSQSLHALESPSMKEKVVMPSPLYSGSASFNLSLIAAHKDFGWDFWNAFLKNNPLLVKGNGSVLDTVAKKGRVCGLILDFMALNAIKDGAGLRFFYFSEGAPVIREPVAILKDSKHKNHAMLFVRFILSKEGQEKLANLGYRPLRDDVAVPEIFKTIGPLKEMRGDANQILNRFESDREMFAKAIS